MNKTYTTSPVTFTLKIGITYMILDFPMPPVYKPLPLPEDNDEDNS